MARTVEQINPMPYEVELVHDDGKVVEINIRAIPGEELTHTHARSAMQAVLRRLPRRPDEMHARTGPQHRRHLTERQTATIEELELPIHQMRQLLQAYEGSEGRITDVYLARLALAYEVAARDHRDVSLRIATALDRPLQTVKGHLMRARKEGYLSPTVEGREGGSATAKAKDLIVSTPVADARAVEPSPTTSHRDEETSPAG